MQGSRLGLALGHAIGVDIGGTTIKFGRVTEAGAVLARRRVPLDPAMPFAAFAQALGDAVEALMGAGPPPAAIGIGVPDYPNPETGGMMRAVPNCPPLTGGSLRDAFTQRFRLPVAIGNDGVCAAQGELSCGAGRHYRRFALITLGTGIGGAVVIDGQIIEGPNGLPPEIGAICLDPSRTDLPDGVPGAFEYLASAKALLLRYRALAGSDAVPDAHTVFDRAKAGETFALRVVDEQARWIAQAIGMMSNLLNLEAVILGGGLSLAGEFLLDGIRPHLGGFYWTPFGRPPALVLAETRNDAGIIGAAALALNVIG
jgi:glucokinase